MAKLVALVAVFAILGLVAVDASIHRTIITTEIDEVDTIGRQQSQKCQQQIRSRDLSQCERFITQSGPMAAFNPEQHRQQCCQQLRKMDEDCRCEALMEMVRLQKQQGQMQREEMQEMMERVRSIPTFCRMGRCQWTEEATMTDDENPQKQGCRQQVREHDMNKCERFIRQSCQRRGNGIVMSTSNPMEKEVQGCCQQLSQVDKQCRCDALKEVLRKQQQQGHVESEEMQEMMQIAQRIPKMCNMEPRTCQWRIALY